MIEAKPIPVLDQPPGENYEPMAQVGWFVDKGNKMFPEPILYQMWSSDKLDEGIVWVKVSTYSKPANL
jgi:hypothetical protein